MSCSKGGFIHQRHNRIRDLFAISLSKVLKDVAIEPHLVPLTGELLNPGANVEDEARLDVSARGFWQNGQRAFFDVKVFNPFAPTHTKITLQKAFDNNEREKKRGYNRRIT